MRLVATMLMLCLVVAGCGVRSEAFAQVNDRVLVDTACKQFKTVTQVEEQALVTDVEAEQKRRILLQGLSKVCTPELVHRYLDSWDKHALAVTLHIDRFQDTQLLKKSSTEAWIRVKVDGEVLDESGASPIGIRYQLMIKKIGSNWLIADIVLEE